jgi:opacity protein-like surface antigen
MLSILLAAAMSGMWDDETFLGRGPMIGAGAAVAITRHLSAEGEAGWSEHHRDSGYLMVDGDTASAAGRLSFAFRHPDAGFRPFVSAGGSWLKSTDLITSTSGRATTRTSLLGWEFGAGAEIKASSHWKIRPEARWTMTASEETFTPGSLEPPLFAVRAGVTMIWTPRK